ncbi:MAG TPA: protein-L-isoaspartate(D-aspartate) O-methyltransferase [Verrucomicrobiae bacterium]|nr:protein-L-isoaspartate(D-aspartate) O-methyltransferase [Verrucomicrobiae bacterium]
MHTLSTARTLTEEGYAELRDAMVETQIRKRGIEDERVLRAMKSVPRHEFVESHWKHLAYTDEPLPIGGGQTISQPYIVAVMCAGLHLEGTEKVLEIGTGCGYQAAVLSCLAREVHTVEYREELASGARDRLQRLGYGNIQIYCGDGSLGLEAFAPYDGILVAAAAPHVPEPLTRQLAEDGRMIVPVGGEEHQVLLLLTKHCGKFSSERREPCRFVPLLGRHGWKDVWI